ncbi:MAG: 30S ribosomal protein S4 [archaeon]
MGDPRKSRKKYATPGHPWQRTRLEEEKVLVEGYGLKNKKDLWKTSAKLTRFKKQAKALIGKRDLQAQTEKKGFLEKLGKLRLINDEATVDNVLDLGIKDILERRLQTIVVRKGFAKTMKQARQFITHGHVLINNEKVDAPSYLVSAIEESTIVFDEKSALADPEHPERKIKELEEARKGKEKPEEDDKEEIDEEVEKE